MVEAKNEVNSSTADDDQLINLAYEAESDDEYFPVKRTRLIHKFFEVSESSESETEGNGLENGLQNGNLKSIKEDEGDQITIDDTPSMNVDDSQFIVIGNEDVGPTCTPMNIKASWIKNAKQFPVAIHKKKNLVELDSITEICKVLRDEVRKYTNSWFPVQNAVLPILIQYEKAILPPRDLVITAPTGSGKTLCFVLPILNALRFVEDGDIPIKVFALIIAPVQSLAQQIFQEFTKYNIFYAKIQLLGLANENSSKDDEIIFKPAHIIISTPGRLVEHLVNPSTTLNLTSLRFLVIDEADRMQDTARIEWLNIVERRARASSTNNITIRDLMNPLQNRWLQKILVSATLSLDIDQLQTWNLRCPLLFKATSKESEQIDEKNLLTLPPNLTHNLILCDMKMKPFLLYQNLIANANWKKVLVFVNKKDTSHRLTLLLDYLAKKSSFSVAELSTNLYEKRRQIILNKFQNEEIRVLICSDMMSRGIDLNDIDCVINYDLPINERIFVHRAGRTARALNHGVLLSLLTKEEKMFMKKMLEPLNLWTENIEDKRNFEKMLTQKLLKNYEKALRSLKEKITK